MPLGEPNLLAYVALFLWVPVTLVLFLRLKPTTATILTLIGGTMLLPEQTVVDPPLIPPIDKGSIAALCALVGCLFKSRRRLTDARPLRGIDLFFVVVLLGNIGTAITNPDVLTDGSVIRERLTLYDAFALGVKDVLAIYLPFFLGRAMLRSRRDLEQLTRVLMVAGMVYSAFALIEIRMSPQLHRWIYGFHQMDFSMTMRFGGYRPMIFMATGLAVGMFFLGTTVVAAARWRAGRAKPWWTIYLAMILVAVKSSGAILYGLVVLPLVLMSKRPRMLLASFLAAMVLLFPLLRGFDVFPVDTLVEQAQKISEERALSLWFRFDQEDQLLDRAGERILFGWGTYNRNRVYDPTTGEDLSVTDGDWMIQLGTRGAVGFIGLYGLLALSVLVAGRRLRRIRSRTDRILLAGFGLVTALFIVDLLPNGLFNYLPFFFAGALYGLSEGLLRSEQKERRRRRRERASAARTAREHRRASQPPAAPR